MALPRASMHRLLFSAVSACPCVTRVCIDPHFHASSAFPCVLSVSCPRIACCLNCFPARSLYVCALAACPCATRVLIALPCVKRLSACCQCVLSLPASKPHFHASIALSHPNFHASSAFVCFQLVSMSGRSRRHGIASYAR
jgi:hypothetical protein